MAATHITEARKAQALRDQADSLLRLETEVAELRAQVDCILAILEPRKPATGEDPKPVEPAAAKTTGKK